MFEEFNRTKFKTILVSEDAFVSFYESSIVEFHESTNYSEENFYDEWEEIQNKVRSTLSKYWKEEDCGSEDFALMEDYVLSFHKAGGVYSKRACCKEFIQIIISSVSTVKNADKWVFHFTCEGDSIGYEFFIFQNKVYIRQSKKLLKHLTKNKLIPESFHRSVEIDHLEWMKKMYKKGLFFTPFKQDKRGNFPQHYLKSIESASFLIDRGFDLNITNMKGHTVLDCILDCEIYNLDIKMLNNPLPTFLIKNGAKTSFELLYPLHYFCMIGEIENVKKYATKNTINMEDSFNCETPIIYSIKSGSIEVLEFIISFGADAKYIDGNGLTIIEKAYHNNVSVKMLEILINSGADIKARSPESWENRSPMFFFYCRMSLDHVKLMLNTGANLNALDSENQNALFHISGPERLEILQYLISKGIDTNVINKEGKTAYQYYLDSAKDYSNDSEFHARDLETARIIKQAQRKQSG